eukprot:768816-Hanusia_phi.AAC.4
MRGMSARNQQISQWRHVDCSRRKPLEELRDKIDADGLRKYMQCPLDDPDTSLSLQREKVCRFTQSDSSSPSSQAMDSISNARKVRDMLSSHDC